MPEVAEHRIALVLNGGISLAIWMGGVVHELDLVRRASRPDAPEPPLPDGDREVFRAWRTACEGRPRLMVDVIAGTSAGGLNGVFLATAIARNGTLAELRRLWMERAQLDGERKHLLDPTRPTVNSVLNGTAFLEGVVEGLAGITPIGDGPGDEVNLTVTASAVGGPAPAFRDSGGTPFLLPDHRRRFRFRSGAGGFEADPEGPPGSLKRSAEVRDFDPATADALAKAGRATASIPGVFDPVAETPLMRQRRRLPERDAGPLDWLLDGGLLDNAPFDAVLDAIAKQPVEASWRRTLAYIVPTAPDPLGPASAGPFDTPSWASTVPSIFTYPGELNLRAGIDRLGAMLDAGRADADVQRFTGLLAAESADLASAVTGLFAFYRASAAAAGIAEADDLASADGVRTLQAAPLAPEAERELGPQSWLPSTPGVELGAPWHWGTAAAERVVRLFLRSIRVQEGGDLDTRRSALHEITERIHAIVRAALRDAQREREREREREPGPIETVLTRIYDAHEVPARVGSLVGDAAVLAGAAHGVDPASALRAALALEVVNGAPGLSVDQAPAPVFDFQRFDVRLPERRFSIDGLRTTGRITDDSDVLHGTRLGHFAAFGKREWREWDWLRGRISAAIHLCDLMGVPDRAEAVITAILAAEETSEEVVTAKARALLTRDGTSSGDLFRSLRRAGGAVGPGSEALLRLGDRWSVAPALPAAGGAVGSVVTAVLARRRPSASRAVHPPAPSPGLLVRVAGSVGRGVVAGPRWLLWRWLGR